VCSGERERGKLWETKRSRTEAFAMCGVALGGKGGQKGIENKTKRVRVDVKKRLGEERGNYKQTFEKAGLEVKNDDEAAGGEK